MQSYLICRKRRSHHVPVEFCIVTKCPKLAQLDDAFVCRHKTKVEKIIEKREKAV